MGLIVCNFLRTIFHRTDTKHEVSILNGIIDEIQFLPTVLESPIGIKIDIWFLTLRTRTAFSSNQNHTIGTTTTVNGCRRRVFQNLHRLDILGRKERNVRSNHSIHNIKRIVTSQRRTDTANTYRSGLSRLTGRGSNRYTGSTSLQGLVQTRHRRLHQFIRTHGSHRTRQVRFLHRTVTDGDELFEHRVLRLEGNRQILVST